MPAYEFTARNNYDQIETFAPYETKREAHAAQDRLAEVGYTDFSAVTEQADDPNDTPDTRPMFACLPEIPVTDEQEPEEEDEPDSVDLIASGYDWTCPNCKNWNPVIEYNQIVTCKDCGHAYAANDPEHAYG